MPTAALTSKGQITIPIEVRKKLGLRPGDRVSFVESRNGEFILKPRNGSIMDLKGIARGERRAVPIEEMNATIAKGWAGLLTFED